LLNIGFSLVETIGISAIMPFISAASNPYLIDTYLYGWAPGFIEALPHDTLIIQRFPKE